MSSLPALTTAWSPPDSCQFTFFSTGQSTGTTSIWLNWALTASQDFTCYPPGFYNAFGTFSPGRCPSQWTTASTFTTSGSTSGAYCCSSGYELIGFEFSSKCRRLIVTPTPVVSVDYISTTITSSITVTTATALVRPLIILWQQKDLSVLTGTPAPGPSTSVPAPTTSGTNGSLPTQTNTSSGSDGLSTGAKAGIGAGVGVTVLILLGIAFLFFIRNRREHKQPPASPPPQPEVGELGNNSAAGGVAKPKPVYKPSLAVHHHASELSTKKEVEPPGELAASDANPPNASELSAKKEAELPGELATTTSAGLNASELSTRKEEEPPGELAATHVVPPWQQSWDMYELPTRPPERELVVVGSQDIPRETNAVGPEVRADHGYPITSTAEVTETGGRISVAALPSPGETRTTESKPVVESSIMTSAEEIEIRWLEEEEARIRSRREQIMNRKGGG